MRRPMPTRVVDEFCNQTRPRRYGYQLRCLEPAGHDGKHRWTPELVDHTGPGSQRVVQPAFPSRTQR
jgi:hypothetical protein